MVLSKKQGEGVTYQNGEVVHTKLGLENHSDYDEDADENLNDF